ncbi:glycosyltransferase family 1 protein [Parabacteroides sp. APC149_11_2_Y6]
MNRILHVFSVMNRGGSETMIMNYYRAMDRTNIQFDFVVHTREKGAYDNEIERLGGRIYYVPFLYGYNIFTYQKAWAVFFRAHPEYKIVHVHYFTVAGAIMPVARRCNVPVRIVHCHTASNKMPFLRLIRFHLLHSSAIRNATDRFACGKDAGKFFFGEKRFTIMNNAIDASSFRFNQELREKKREELGLSGKFVIGNIARFNIQKNHTFIIDVFAEVCKINSCAVLLLIGDGQPLRGKIEQKVATLGLTDRVIFAGVRSDIPELLQAMDVFLFPSLWEGLPVTMIEAQAAGLRVVASDTVTTEVNITELVDNLSLNSSPKIWAEKINQSGCDYFHSDTFNQICNANYDIKNNVIWLENYYKNIQGDE